MVLVGGVVHVPRTVVAERDEQPPLVPPLAAGAQAVDDVAAEMVHRSDDKAVVGDLLVAKPRPELRAGHRVGGT
ncbi:hypothetical protein ACQRET_31615, partial [Streptomyces koyangensis]|uniref:hypothetical protein n=1 Tax=Streptomyces koyangensis TaxID=188770 RepID=UPI003D0074C1